MAGKRGNERGSARNREKALTIAFLAVLAALCVVEISVAAYDTMAFAHTASMKGEYLRLGMREREFASKIGAIGIRMGITWLCAIGTSAAFFAVALKDRIRRAKLARKVREEWKNTY